MRTLDANEHVWLRCESSRDCSVASNLASDDHLSRSGSFRRDRRVAVALGEVVDQRKPPPVPFGRSQAEVPEVPLLPPMSAKPRTFQSPSSVFICISLVLVADSPSAEAVISASTVASSSPSSVVSTELTL